MLVQEQTDRAWNDMKSVEGLYSPNITTTTSQGITCGITFGITNDKSVIGISKHYVDYIIWATSWQNKQTDLCTKRRLKSAWASAQSDQSLRCALYG